MLPILYGIINSEIEDYVQFLEEKVGEVDIDDNTFACKDLTKMIRAYYEIRPQFAIEVKKRIIETDKKLIIDLFNRIVSSSKFLTKVYEK